MKPEVNCNNCKHYGDDYGLGKCKAFPDGIPLPIAAGNILHDKPFNGDKGIRFTPMDDPYKQDSLNSRIDALRDRLKQK